MAADSGEVKAIDRRTVHQICSGQVVLSLAVAVKELVENSLDAGATSVEVRLKEHGLELVEVLDNGCGVAPANFAALTLKHHTSKLSEFDDLLTVSTFGFRGEALSSLCALSNLEVITCHRTQSVGTKLEYDSNGLIKSQTSCAREVGTTISLHNLFHSLPVRYKEFQRNIKKEFSRMVHMLQAYCLISTGVHMSCYNQSAKGKRQLVLGTSGAASVRENIVAVFGQKQLQSCVELRECDKEAMLEGEGEEPDPVTMDAVKLFKLSGVVSRCTHGSGRSTVDRQFFYCNGRPFELPRLSKTVNEVYHTYNRHQNPFIVLNIQTSRDRVDVNITPDKRRVIIEQEKALLLLVKASLHKVYHSMQGEYEAAQSVGKSPSLSAAHTSGGNGEAPEVSAPSPSLSKLFSMKRLSGHGGAGGAGGQGCDAPRPKQPKLFNYGIERSDHGGGGGGVKGGETLDSSHSISESLTSTVVQDKPTVHADCSTNTNAHEGKQPLAYSEVVCEANGDNDLVNGESNSGESHVWQSSYRRAHTNMTTSCSSKPSVERVREHMVVCDMSLISQRLRLRLSCCSGDGEKVEVKCEEGEGGCEGVTREKRKMRFRARPHENEAAETELRREISKEMFKEMVIIGQFNLGFIIAKLKGTHLFIIDQHASDERYNYERIQKGTVLDHQSLIQPKVLGLTSVAENIVMDNLEIFKMNGFQFHFDSDAPPTQRLRLVTQPVYRGVKLGSDEIDEMIFLLSDSPGEAVRPSKIKRIFASNACRMSVMIGKPLSRVEMKKLVSNLGSSTVDHPWSCPHGRPTFRHLVDISTP